MLIAKVNMVTDVFLRPIAWFGADIRSTSDSIEDKAWDSFSIAAEHWGKCL